MPSSIVLYVARRELQGTCGDDVAPAIEFPPDSADVAAQQKVEIEKWALCLQRPELRKASVVLVPPAPSSGGAALFEKRAKLLRDSLTARGVDASRLGIGAASTSGAAGEPSPANAIRLEVVRATDRKAP